MTVQQSTRVEAQPPLTEIALRKLRSDVLAGNLEAGSKLKIDTLQQEYAISSSPLREALSRLTQEGLVRSDERKGFRVAPLSIEDLEDITRMRLMLDIEALQESIAMGDDEWDESPRELRRLLTLRRWSHEQQEVQPFFPRGARACRADGA